MSSSSESDCGCINEFEKAMAIDHMAKSIMLGALRHYNDYYRDSEQCCPEYEEEETDDETTTVEENTEEEYSEEEKFYYFWEDALSDEVDTTESVEHPRVPAKDEPAFFTVKPILGTDKIDEKTKAIFNDFDVHDPDETEKHDSTEEAVFYTYKRVPVKSKMNDTTSDTVARDNSEQKKVDNGKSEVEPVEKAQKDVNGISKDDAVDDLEKKLNQIRV